MKKALILAYDFPPYNSIGGQRPYSWYLYLKESGIEPTVVTRHWDIPISGPNDCYLPSKNRVTTRENLEHGTIIRAPFNPTFRDKLIGKTDILSVFFRKLLSFLEVISSSRIAALDGKRTIYETAEKLMQEQKFDVIVATGEPFILFHYAANLSAKFNTPWIGDYRDGWSTNFHASGAFSFLTELFEKQTVKSASLLTTAAPIFSKQIAELTGREEDKIPVIFNGYFEEKFNPENVVELKPKFSIAHVGTLYPFQRIETFLDGLQLFLDKNPEVEFEVNFYGLNFYPDQIARIKGHSRASQIKFTDKMPHADIIMEMLSSHLLLLLATPDKHQIYAKVFDYLASGRPILLVENDCGPLEQILSNRGNATICSNASDVASYLEQVYFHPKLLVSEVNSDDTFTRRNQTKRFAEAVLKAIEK